MERLFVSVDPYNNVSGKYTHLFKGETLLECMYQVMDKCNYAYWEDDEDPLPNTIELILNRLKDSNGDGCDFIISIIDLNKGEVLFSE